MVWFGWWNLSETHKKTFCFSAEPVNEHILIRSLIKSRNQKNFLLYLSICSKHTTNFCISKLALLVKRKIVFSKGCSEHVSFIWSVLRWSSLWFLLNVQHSGRLIASLQQELGGNGFVMPVFSPSWPRLAEHIGNIVNTLQDVHLRVLGSLPSC